MAGVACEVVGVTDTEVTCRTGEHPKAVKAVVKVVIGSSGEAKVRGSGVRGKEVLSGGSGGNYCYYSLVQLYLKKNM